MNDFINPNIDDASENIENLFENLINLENSGYLASEHMDEIVYYLRRIIDIANLPVVIDRFNDSYLNEISE